MRLALVSRMFKLPTSLRTRGALPLPVLKRSVTTSCLRSLPRNGKKTFRSSSSPASSVFGGRSWLDNNDDNNSLRGCSVTVRAAASTDAPSSEGKSGETYEYQAEVNRLMDLIVNCKFENEKFHLKFPFPFLKCLPFTVYRLPFSIFCLFERVDIWKKKKY